MKRVYERHNPRAAAAERDKARGPNGRRLCRWCATEVEPPRRTFCSEACVDEWNIRSSPSYARQKVYERDKGVCALCGVDTGKQAKELRAEFGVQHSRPAADREKAFYARLRALHISSSRWHETFGGLWDMDHTVPVIEGGGSCGLENLRTLCLRCHWQQTRTLGRRRSQRRKKKRLGSYELF